jgi:hypothetical protein
MVVTLWSVWYARRKAIYESIFQSPHQTISFVNNYIGELDQLASLAVRPAAPLATPAEARRWLPPAADQIKVNVDGAVARHKRCGAAAAVCRDADGLY